MRLFENKLEINWLKRTKLYLVKSTSYGFYLWLPKIIVAAINNRVRSPSKTLTYPITPCRPIMKSP